MSRIDFYHLQKQSLNEILPKLLHKVLNSGKRALIKTDSEATSEEINNWLWVYKEDSFMPHGSKKDGFAEQQPIWICSDGNNANHAEFLFLVKGSEPDGTELSAYERIFNIFDGNSETALIQARRLWKEYKDQGHNVCYWQQSAQGTWEQKI